MFTEKVNVQLNLTNYNNTVYTYNYWKMFSLIHKIYLKKEFSYPSWVKEIINLIFQFKQFYPGSDKDRLLRRRSQQMCGHGKVLWLINNADRRYPAFNDFVFGYAFGKTIFCLYHLLQEFHILKLITLHLSKWCTNRIVLSHVTVWRRKLNSY